MALAGITPRELNNTNVDLQKDFNDSYKASLEDSNNWAPPHVKVATTSKKLINYIFYGDMDSLDELNDLQNDEFETILGYTLNLDNTTYGKGVKITLEDFNADAKDLSLLPQQVQIIATKAALLWKDLAISILNNGATAAVQTYDGVSLYNNAHVVGDGTFDNLLAGTGDFGVDLETLYQAMLVFQNDIGQVREGNIPTHVIHPIGLRKQVLEELNSTSATVDNKNSGVVNTNFRLVSPIMEPKLTDANDWFAMRSQGLEIPFIGLHNPGASPTRDQLVSDNRPNVQGQIVDEWLKWKYRTKRKLHPSHPHLHCKVVNA